MFDLIFGDISFGEGVLLFFIILFAAIVMITAVTAPHAGSILKVLAV